MLRRRRRPWTARVARGAPALLPSRPGCPHTLAGPPRRRSTPGRTSPTFEERHPTASLPSPSSSSPSGAPRFRTAVVVDPRGPGAPAELPAPPTPGPVFDRAPGTPAEHPLFCNAVVVVPGRPEAPCVRESKPRPRGSATPRRPVEPDFPGQEDNFVVSAMKDCETICWGCGLRLLLSSYSPVFKCGWCGAITNHNQKSRTPDSVCFSKWRCIRDRLFIATVFLFMLFVICAGVWAVYPVVFSVSYFCGVFHSSITAILSICTMSSFFFSSSRSAGAPADVIWGSYPVVQKGSLEDYTFCTYCAKPKSPRAHHCRSCRMCVLDMDHHCPFIGNCVGAANHQYFISFLISIVVSCTYVVAMSTFAGHHIWPPLEYDPLGSSIHTDILGAIKILKEVLVAFANSALLVSPRGLVLMYLTMAGLSVEIGISVLLWQQLKFIYEGKTYLDHISSQEGLEKKGCQNILRFFGCPYWAYKIFRVSSHTGKLQETSSSKLL